MIVPDVFVDRFDDRRQLLVGLDRVKRKMDQQGFPGQAMRLLNRPWKY